MPVFVDTGAFVALMVAEDDHHHSAVSVYREVKKTGTLVTSDDVFDETITRLRRKVGYADAIRAGRTLRADPEVKILPLTGADRDRAWALFERFGADVKSLTDCSSAAIMERLDIETIFTFDSDFIRFSKTVVPGP